MSCYVVVHSQFGVNRAAESEFDNCSLRLALVFVWHRIFENLSHVGILVSESECTMFIVDIVDISWTFARNNARNGQQPCIFTTNIVHSDSEMNISTRKKSLIFENSMPHENYSQSEGMFVEFGLSGPCLPRVFY